ncbi:ABC transporter permease [Ancylomarina sp. 16SWW S1-10-2]|uniref:ABC transporter permease n=1 Tax=Ancylomarina sp. 16SWW S1-10-2 TaxID=2499681 RepID=UPI0012AE444B|nr:ABC transporter permease [Ancylomarina sp. 16SWW S1-10-2]MRT93589.1 ABC transporter permease [Ancylomarina sp. 16SWW S1-10-2]
MQSFFTSCFYNVLIREIKRIFTSPVYLFFCILAPVISFFVLMAIFSKGVPRDLPIAMVDQDHTSLSRNITRMVDATSIAGVAYQSASLEQAKKLMNKGDVEAVIVIPHDTERDVIRGEQANIALYINNTNVVKGGMLQSGLHGALATASGGVKLSMAMKNGATLHQAKAKVLPVRLDKHALFNPFVSYSYFLTLGILPVMLIVFTLLGALYALGIELKDGTGRELLEISGNSVVTAVTAKLLPYLLLFMVDAMVMNLIIFPYMSTPIHGSLTLIILSEFVMVVAYLLLAVFFLAVTANMRLSLSLAGAYTMMSLTFSGLTFPRFGMPLVAKFFSVLFPFTFWLEIFMGQTLRGEAPINAIYPLYIFLIFIFMGLLSLPKFKKILQDERYWGGE